MTAPVATDRGPIEDQDEDQDRPGSFRKRVILAAALGVGVFAAVYLAWHVLFWLAVAFSAVLVGVALRGLADLVAARTPLGAKAALAVVVVVLLAATLGGGWLTATRVGSEAQQLADELPRAWENAKPRIAEIPGGGVLLNQVAAAAEDGVLPDAESFDVAGLAARAWRYGRSVIAVLAGLLLVFVTGLYLAASPDTYTHGFVTLLPDRQQPRVRDALGKIAHTLRWWLVGQVTAMAVLGTLTMIGLWLLGVPMFVALGVLTAILCFIPNLGPILSVLPPVVLALGQPEAGLALAGKVVLLYVGIQLVESYLITPLIQKKAVSLPPALLIVGQVVAGAVLGILGIALAAPALAATIAGVRVLYLDLDEPC